VSDDRAKVAALRDDTPGCDFVLHLDHAGSSLPPEPVLQAVLGHLGLEARLGGYRAAAAVADRCEQVYADVAALVGAQPDEIALVDSATRAWQLAFAALPLSPGDRVLCSRTEYVSNHLAFLQLAERHDLSIVPIDGDEQGALDLHALERELSRGAAVMCLTHVPTNGGLVHPARQVGLRTRAAGVPLLLDACQSVGQVDVRDVPWDLLSATGRKYLRGPRGTGFLAVRRDWLQRLRPPMADLRGARWESPDRYTLRDDARRFELWERSVAGQLGLGAAARVALDTGLPWLQGRIAALGASLRSSLQGVPGLTVHDQGRQWCGIVTFSIDGVDPVKLKEQLWADDIHTSVSAPSSTLIDAVDRGLPPMLRASVHALNTDDELERFVARIRRAAHADMPSTR
jgi:selenocysteine lyase/cysteine desulfurase